MTPEISRVVNEFNHILLSESQINDELDDLQLPHHEHSHNFQKKFHEKAKGLYTCISNYGNPFAIEDSRLLRLTTQILKLL